MPTTQRCCPCCDVCPWVIGPFNTGEPAEDGSGILPAITDSDGNTCFEDEYWEADGSPARIVDPQFSYGCPVPGKPLWISTLCDGYVAGSPGGIDGAEMVFTSYFEILPEACLARILLSGRYSADNYIKAGSWKINGIDQCQIYHGTYYNSLAINCIEFEITHEQGQFVHGTNTVEITVKNGYWLSGDFGGPQGFAIQWGCFDILDGYDDVSCASSLHSGMCCVTEPDERDEP